jgi:hypothetical protein
MRMHTLIHAASHRTAYAAMRPHFKIMIISICPLSKNILTKEQNEKIIHIILNSTNYLSWMNTTSIGLGERSKLEYVIGELPKLIPVNPKIFTAQEKRL